MGVKAERKESVPHSSKVSMERVESGNSDLGDTDLGGSRWFPGELIAARNKLPLAFVCVLVVLLITSHLQVLDGISPAKSSMRSSAREMLISSSTKGSSASSSNDARAHPPPYQPPPPPPPPSRMEPPSHAESGQGDSARAPPPNRIEQEEKPIPHDDHGEETLKMWEDLSLKELKEKALANEGKMTPEEPEPPEEAGYLMEEDSGPSSGVSSTDSAGSGEKPSGIFRGVELGVVDGVNITRLSHMVFRVMKQTNSTSLLDFPCVRNREWMPAFVERMEWEMRGFHFTCGATSKDEARIAKKAFKSDVDLFVHALADTRTLLPTADLMFSWNGMQHWPLDQSWNLIRLGRASCKYLLLGSNPHFDNLRLITRHDSIASGKVNLRKQPMLLDKALKVVDNLTFPDGPSHPMVLMMWQSSTMKRTYGGHF